MAATDLKVTVLSLADDPTQAVAGVTTGWSDTSEQAGSVRVMANGRRRVVARADTSRTLAWTFVFLTPEQARTLRAWAGRTVLVRDSKGRKVFGVYWGLAVSDRRTDGLCDVALSVQSITHSELA